MSFTELFYKGIMLRPSCGKCHYANTTRPSDITIADFWGWEKTDNILNKDDKGVSLVLINTEKGRLIFDAIKNRMITVPAKLEDCIQPNLRQPTKLHPDQKYFERDYANCGFEYAYKKYCSPEYKQKWTFARFMKRIWRKTTNYFK